MWSVKTNARDVSLSVDGAGRMSIHGTAPSGSQELYYMGKYHSDHDRYTEVAACTWRIESTYLTPGGRHTFLGSGFAYNLARAVLLYPKHAHAQLHFIAPSKKRDHALSVTDCHVACPPDTFARFVALVTQAMQWPDATLRLSSGRGIVFVDNPTMPGVTIDEYHRGHGILLGGISLQARRGLPDLAPLSTLGPPFWQGERPSIDLYKQRYVYHGPDEDRDEDAWMLKQFGESPSAAFDSRTDDTGKLINLNESESRTRARSEHDDLDDELDED
jgi:hypothetical protein